MDAGYERQVGQRLRTIREARKMTQEQLAAKLQVNGCDITRSALAKMEVGQRHIYLDELKLLVSLLHVDYADVL